MRLLKRTAIVTGSSQGLGREIAARFVREGASVLLCARSGEKLEAVAADLEGRLAPDAQLLRVVADVSKEADFDAVIEKAVAAWGRIDILVNCAGSAGPRGAFEGNDWKAWREAVEVNLFGAAYGCHAVIPHMKRAGSGKIINLSGGGATKPLPSLSSYAASKAGVVRLTETLAWELKDWRIDVNAVAPGILATKLAEDVMDVGEGLLGKGYFEEVKRQKQGNMSAFEKATDLCAFLASAESDGITGRLISAPWDPWQTLADRVDELASSDIYTLRRITPEDRGRTWGGGG